MVQTIEIGFCDPGSERLLVCPYCGFGYLHIDAVRYGRGEWVPVGVSVNDEVIAWGRYIPERGRGNRIVVEFSGECGHKFGLMLQHHKGQTFITCIETEELMGKKGGVEWNKDV